VPYARTRNGEDTEEKESGKGERKEEKRGFTFLHMSKATDWARLLSEHAL